VLEVAPVDGSGVDQGVEGIATGEKCGIQSSEEGGRHDGPGLPLDSPGAIPVLDQYSDPSILRRVGTRGRSNPLALAVLACLLERPMHPYEVAQTLRTRAKHESIKLNYGSLYTVVGSLEARGLVAAGEPTREGRRPERTVYKITEAGEHEVVDWLSELIAQPTKEYLQFEAALALMGALPPDDALQLLRARVVNVESEVESMRSVMDGAKKTWGLARTHLLEAEYVGVLLEAELAWLRNLITDIAAGDLDGIDEWRAWHVDQGGDT
jgi:DNA-binding PadR family transcriptional regulator